MSLKKSPKYLKRKGNNRKPQTRVMIFGTFDVLHKGHLNFFRQARKLSSNPFLIVSVARDANVKKIKGQKPLHNERQRLKVIKNCELVDKAVLGGLKAYLPHILKVKPRIIALGYDQYDYVKGLEKALKSRGWRGKIIRLRPFKPTIYKSSLLKNRRIMGKTGNLL